MTASGNRKHKHSTKIKSKLKEYHKSHINLEKNIKNQYQVF